MMGAIAGATLLAMTGCAGSAGGGGTSAGADGELPTIELSFSHVVAEKGHIGDAGKALIAALDENYDGDVSVDWFFSGALTPGAEMLDALNDGRASLSNMPTAYFPDQLPVSTWTDPLPTTAGPAPMAAVTVGSLATSEMYRDAALTEEYAKHGITPIATPVNDYFYLICNKPITSLEDAKGVTVRAASRTHVGELEALGMTPVSLEWGETFEALQRGAIDCTASPLVGTAELGIFDIAKHIALVPLAPTVVPVLMNTDKFNSLPEDVQEFLLTEGASVYLKEFLASNIRGAQDLFVGDGVLSEGTDVQITAPEDMIQVLTDYRASHVKGLASSAPAAAGDAQAIIDAYADAVARGLAIYEKETGLPASGFSNVEETVNAFRDISDPDAVASALAAEFLSRVSR